jgi:hypothetical protein
VVGRERREITGGIRQGVERLPDTFGAGAQMDEIATGIERALT